MWLSLCLHKAIGINISNLSFPSDYAEDATPETRRCTSFGEVASTIKGDSSSGTIHYSSGTHQPSIMNLRRKSWFGSHAMMKWVHLNFHSNSSLTKLARKKAAQKIFKYMITPGILPDNFHLGQDLKSSYEFYLPSAVSCQLRFGQLLPPQPFFVNLILLWEKKMT